MKKLLILLCFICTPLYAQSDFTVCANVQMYNALERIKQQSAFSFNTYYDNQTNLYHDLVNQKIHCDSVISSDLRLPYLLSQANLTNLSTLKAFAISPLIVWSNDKNLFSSIHDKKPIINKKLKSLAICDKSLTPVGYATSEVVKRADFPTLYLKNSIFRPEHEFKAYALLKNNSVQAGIISLNLIMKNNTYRGSYYLIPQSIYPKIYYYAFAMSNLDSFNSSTSFIRYLQADRQVQYILKQNGFVPIQDND